MIKKIIYLLLFAAIAAGGIGYYLLLKSNVKHSKPYSFYFKSDWTYDELSTHIHEELLANPIGFNALADKMNLGANLYPGKYIIEPGLSNMEIIRTFRSGRRTDVDVVIKSHVRPFSVFARLADQLEPDSASIAHAFLAEGALAEIDLNKKTWPSIFQANTYKLNWASSPDEIKQRFIKEYRSYWNDERLMLAGNNGLTPSEVFVLASIVDGESTKIEEMPTIAGVYLNRLRRSWPLQADPTLLFIANESGRQRVLNEDKEVEHPYNTYKRQGLPPGPIMLASPQAIKAVLSPEDHNYMFFCAKADFSNSHAFAVTLDEHNRNAVAYRRALDKRGIMR
jgi:UPF0755 protein